MNAPAINPIKLGIDQLQPAAQLLSRAFFHDPTMVYFIPDEEKRRRKLHIFFQTMLRYCMTHGEVQATSPALEAVIAWLPGDKADLPFFQLIRAGGISIITQLGISSTLRQLHCSAAMNAVHYRLMHTPHLYGFLLGVEPSLKGKGYASSLMRSFFQRAHSEGLPCYGDNTNEKNLPIYLHMGGKVLEEYTVPKTNVKIWAILWQP